MSTTEDLGTVREQAARWVIRLTEGPDSLSSADLAELHDFLADPERAREFQAISTMTVMTADLGESESTRLDKWAKNYTEKRSRVVVNRWWALAASVLVAVIVGTYYANTQHLFGESAYVTHTGEKKSIRFPDGSVAFLNTKSELRWIGTGDERRVELVAGEALFEVVHDPAHPFVVVLDNSEIRVLGTRFNVYRKPSGDTTVTTIEGTVQVVGFAKGSAEPAWKRTISANQEVGFRPIGLVSEVHPTEAQDAVLWRSDMYRFQNKSVKDVLDELSRYTDQTIVIRDPDISNMLVSGSFRTRSATEALSMLKTVAPIEVREKNGGFIIVARGDQGKD
jgi:transmembrane sensor